MDDIRRVLIAGSGYVGRAVAGLLAQRGVETLQVSRTSSPVQADLSNRSSLDGIPGDFDAVVFAAGIKGGDADAYASLFVAGMRNLLSRLQAGHRPPRIMIMVSTTGVYHVTDGSWVDEDRPADPARTGPVYYRKAEDLMWSAPWPTSAIRMSGIYGPGRDRLIRRVRDGQEHLDPGPVRYVNHIHVEDAAAAILHVMSLPSPASIYIGSDREPADRNEVLRFIADRLGLSPPPIAESPLPPGRGGNKRCRPGRLEAGGFTFRYPSYREGYAALMEATT